MLSARRASVFLSALWIFFCEKRNSWYVFTIEKIDILQAKVMQTLHQRVGEVEQRRLTKRPGVRGLREVVVATYVQQQQGRGLWGGCLMR